MNNSIELVLNKIKQNIKQLQYEKISINNYVNLIYLYEQLSKINTLDFDNNSIIESFEVCLQYFILIAQNIKVIDRKEKYSNYWEKIILSYISYKPKKLISSFTNILSISLETNERFLDDIIQYFVKYEPLYSDYILDIFPLIETHFNNYICSLNNAFPKRVLGADNLYPLLNIEVRICIYLRNYFPNSNDVEVFLNNHISIIMNKSKSINCSDIYPVLQSVLSLFTIICPIIPYTILKKYNELLDLIFSITQSFYPIRDHDIYWLVKYIFLTVYSICPSKVHEYLSSHENITKSIKTMIENVQVTSLSFKNFTSIEEWRNYIYSLSKDYMILELNLCEMTHNNEIYINIINRILFYI